MLTIDIAFFPHIFDLILDFPDVKTLARLRRISRAVRDKVDNTWGHLEWNVAPRAPSVVYNRRGAIVPPDSACLRFTRTLDIVFDTRVYERGKEEFAESINPEVIRVLSYDNRESDDIIDMIDFPSVSTVIFHHLKNLSGPVDSIHFVHRLIMICKFDGFSLRESDLDFHGAGRFFKTDVYVVLSDLDPTGVDMEALRGGIMKTLILWRDACTEIEINPVDIASWFDVSDTNEEPTEKTRLDQVLADPGGFYGSIVNTSPLWHEGSNADNRWPTAEELSLLGHIHRITKEEMRQRVGDRAYDLTFAPTIKRHGVQL